MKDETRTLQDTVRTLEDRVAKLEKAHSSQQATAQATEVSRAVDASEASIRILEKD